MKGLREDVQRVEKALISAYRGQERSFEMSSRLKAGIMSSIGQSEVNGGVWDALFGRAVWRFAAATCLVAVVLLFFAAHSGLDTEYEIARLILDDSTDIVLAQSFGIN